MLAMQMILLMESQDTVDRFPNIQYVTDRSFDKLPTARDVKAQPTLDPSGSFDTYAKYLRDMLPYVEADVYNAFHNALSDGSLTDSDLPTMLGAISKVFNVIAETKLNLQLWDGDFPHGCYWILRDVVPLLLEPRMS
jgi:hypothetical protein